MPPNIFLLDVTFIQTELSLIYVFCFFGFDHHFNQEQIIMKAGFYAADITPPIGTMQAGNYNKQYLKGVAGPLKIRAAVFEQDGKQVALAGVDCCSISDKVINRALEIAKNHGTSFDSHVISASHTHSGAALSSFFDLDIVAKADQKVIDLLKDSPVPDPLVRRMGNTTTGNSTRHGKQKTGASYHQQRSRTRRQNGLQQKILPQGWTLVLTSWKSESRHRQALQSHRPRRRSDRRMARGRLVDRLHPELRMPRDDLQRSPGTWRLVPFRRRDAQKTPWRRLRSRHLQWRLR
jgi:hypothetical protein